MTKKKFNVSGMHCASCAMTIEWGLEDLGVKAKCSYAEAKLEVEYEPGKVAEKEIIETVEKSGYLLTDQ